MCGIVGIYTPKRPDAAQQAAAALFSQQHRGQESCGIAWADGERLRLHKRMGLVKEVFTPETLAGMKTGAAIGHVRYPTQGGVNLDNAQPHLVETLSGPHHALVSNGDLINYAWLRQEMARLGIHLCTANDGEAIARLLVYLLEVARLDPETAIRRLFTQLEGAYSTLVLTPREMIAFRDPYGFRPMILGQSEHGYAVTSESCALDTLRVSKIREVAPGEILFFRPEGVTSVQTDAATFRTGQRAGTAHCVFELIYFARPDSFQFGRRVYEIRRQIGQTLATYDDTPPDCVVPVPDSANMMALGYAQGSGATFEMGLIRNHYVGRTFIKPAQIFRDESVKEKFNPLSGFFQDKRIVLVDDSIVRGTTLRKIVRMVKGAGAREVHVRIGSPPVRYPCFYGIDIPTYEELIANKKKVDEIRAFIQADSLKYLELGDLLRIVRNGVDFCSACFGGEYPVGTPVPGKRVTGC